jgi:Fe2+ or Zn2+ uptake regulation protein
MPRRQTKQRSVILGVLTSTDQHPTANWIHTEARKVLPRIGLGTVYRLLDELVDEGLARRFVVGNGPSRYEYMPHPHAHVICTTCGRITDAPELDLLNATARIEQATGYLVSQLRFDGYGLCPTCRVPDQRRTQWATAEPDDMNASDAVLQDA